MTIPVRIKWIAGLGCAVVAASIALATFVGRPEPRELADRHPRELPDGYPDHPVRKPSPPDDADQYVGNAACAECHAEISQSFSSTPMAQTLVRVPEPMPLETFGDEAEFSAGKRRRMRVDLVDGRMVHRETHFDTSGKEIVSRVMPIDLALGSGRLGRSYVYQRDGVLFFSPVTWYHQGAGLWDLSPNRDPELPLGELRIERGCFFCHAEKVLETERGADRFQPQIVVGGGISCERCHGPGRGHVLRHSALESDRPSQDPIVNPARLPQAERDDVCYQCHQQGRARIERYGRDWWDFRPGRRLDEFILVFDDPPQRTREGPVRAVDHASQLHASRCYTESPGRLWCGSCHDSHRGPVPAAESAQFFRQKCLSCHESATCTAPESAREERQDSCVACHMPARKAHGVAHTSATDHRIVKRLEDEAEDQDPEYTEQWFLSEATRRRLPVWEYDRARALIQHRGLAKGNRSVSIEEPLAILERTTGVAPDDGEALTTAGDLLLRLERYPEARQRLEAALAAEGDREGPLDKLVLVSQKLGDREGALAYMDRYLKTNPAISDRWAARANLLQQEGRLSEAIESLERAIEIDPAIRSRRLHLAALYKQAGRPDDARRHEEIARRLEGGTAMP